MRYEYYDISKLLWFMFMCGLIWIKDTPQQINDEFDILTAPEFIASYNVAPTHYLPIVFQPEEHRLCRLMKWGLIPRWSKEPKTKFSTINARAETVNTSKLYAGPFRQTRCIIPINGFYEWRQDDGKQPYSISKPDQSFIGLAGLWEVWHQGHEDELYSFTIIVTEANKAVSNIHDRMPVILQKTDYSTWLSPTTDTKSCLDLLHPYSGELLIYPVSKKVNSPKNNGPELLNEVNL